MMVYKIHLTRILIVFIMLLTLLSVLIFLAPPNCVQVSVSIQHIPTRTVIVDGETPPLSNTLRSHFQLLLNRTEVYDTLQKPRPHFHLPMRAKSYNKPNILKPHLYHHLPLKSTVQNTEGAHTLLSKPRTFIYSSSVQPSSISLFKNKPDSAKVHTDAFFRTRLVQNNVEYEDNDDVGDDDEFDNDYDDDSVDNKVFEVGDFDYNGTNNLVVSNLVPGVISRKFVYSVNFSDLAYPDQTLLLSSKRQRNISLINMEGIPVVEDGIYWSEELENIAPKGADDSAIRVSLNKMRASRVQRVEAPTWNRCGRPKNQFVVFEDGSKACARYRAPHHYLVQGEVLSFHLSRLLGMRHVPAVALSSLREDKWGSVREQLLSSAKWEDNATLALIQWVDNLERDRLPPLLLSSLLEKRTVSPGELLNLSSDSLVELMQWTDLILFDYITGNYDRVASMQDAADKEGRSSILAETVHNVVRSRDDGALWLLDNESGFSDAYSLLYGGQENSRFRSFHSWMLHSVCVWRRRTVESLRKMVQEEEAGHTLKSRVQEEEDSILFGTLPDGEVWRRLQERIEEVEAHIAQCKEAAQ